MRLFITSYTLPNGQHGSLHVTARSWYEALQVLWGTFGDLRSCSVRPI
jgi:hypothetical protein